jgi:hypothetical protein
VDLRLSGPRRVAPKNQVTIPNNLMLVLDVHVGDDVYMVSNPDRPGTIVILSKSQINDVFQKGWTALS